MSRVDQLYKQRLADGVLAPDPAQADAVARLDALEKALVGSQGWFGEKKHKGLYLWGGVGRGKSMLMDLFFEAARVKEKRRVHFHDFMLETHAFIFEWRKLSQDERRKHPAHVRGSGDDPMPPAARHIADHAQLLCFDEFHVNQIADAMILGRLFEQLFDRGVTVVATSNRKPSDLYKDGINRQLFLPFIKRLEDELDVVELKAARDYRLERLTVAPVYYSPLGPAAYKAMDAAFARLTAGAAPSPDTLEVQGRKVSIPQQAMGVARFEFDALCKQPLGAADYLTIARHYHTVLIDHVPKMITDQRTWAARFVTLIDALYESKTKLVMSADAQPDDLYPAGDGAFEFQRTASRLHEMRSDDYLASEREHTHREEPQPK
ncbi:MAG TPA: cell division protein ZapE [Hyphomonadaceae bacterium]|jgi:cell division protein ZapE|nr:cell division protein ZapE [Hyphomonadaceae bacterium]